MTATAEARQTTLPTINHRQRKRLSLSTYDRRKPLYQAVSTPLHNAFGVRAAYSDCIKDGSFIEPCCGTGRVMVPLAKAGHNVTGIDADEGMLARIPAKAEGLENLRYSLANALTADWGGNYDVVVLGGNTLTNIEHREDDKAAQKLMIQKAADALRPGGHFFLAYYDYPEPEKIFVRENKVIKWYYSGTDDTGVTGQIYNCGGLYNPVTRITTWTNHIELTLPDGEKHIIPGHGHKYACTRDDVHGWLKDAGFVIEEEFGGYDRRPIDDGQGLDVIWARKV